MVNRLDKSELRVAIDGPAGAGKSTLGRNLAARLNCRFLDTGLMYRAVTSFALRQGIDPEDGGALGRLAATIDFQLPANTGEELYVNGEPASDELRSAAVDAAVSAVSRHPEVRGVLVGQQRELAEDGCIVMVGRDIGTVVLPNADLKLWVSASARERARRRRGEGLEGSGDRSDGEIMGDILARDAQDSGREVSPLRRPPDAVQIETDRVSPDQAAERAMEAVRERLASRDSVR